MSPTLTATSRGESISVAYTLAGQIVELVDFAQQNGNAGMVMPPAGLVSTATYSMRPASSTKASKVPADGSGKTNNLTVLRSAANVTAAKFSGWTLQATEQGHPYNGVTFDNQTDHVVSGIKVIGIPGYQHYPPGETFPMNDWHGIRGTFSDIEIDGRGVSAASFGANSCTDITVNQLNAHDCPYSRPTFWMTNGITLNDVRSVNNWGGINLEQCSGRIRINRPVLRPSPASSTGMHLHLNNIAGDNKDIVITDPDTGGVPFRMHLLDGYRATTDPVTGVVTRRQSQTSYPLITRGGVPLQWIDGGGGGWAKALTDPMRYAVRFH